MNSYLIGTLIIILGYIWFGVIIANEGDMVQTMSAFFFTISGIGFWAIGYYSGVSLNISLFKRRKKSNQIKKQRMSQPISVKSSS